MRKTIAIIGCLVVTLTSLRSIFAQDGGGGGRGRFQRGGAEAQQDENSGGGGRFGRRGGGAGEDGSQGQQGGDFGRGGGRFGGDPAGGGGFGRGGAGGDQVNAAGGTGGGPGGFNRGQMRGGADQSGNPGGGFGRGGGPGGGFGMGGGPGGGMNTADFAKRLDANGNGVIDPIEMDGRARFMIERAGMDPNAPVSVEKLAAAMEQMRNERGDGGGPGGGRANRRDGESQSGNEAGGNNKNTKSGKSPANEKPLVPGFGEQVSLQTVPSFGEPAAPADSKSESKSSSKFTPKQVRYRTPSERLPDGLPDWFLRDSEGEGQVMMYQFHGPNYLTAWNDARIAEFAKYDLNGDGVITPDEALKVAGKR